MESQSEVVGEEVISPRNITLTALLEGERPESIPDCLFLIVWNGQILLEEKWENGISIENREIPINLKDSVTAYLVADIPLVFLLRPASGKGTKDNDPLLNVENRAGANIDMLPLLLGEEKVETRVGLVYIMNGQSTGCFVDVCISAGVGRDERVPILLTMISATCLPQQVKEGTVYLSALALDGLLEPIGVSFGMSSTALSDKKITWGSISAIGYAAESQYNIPEEDQYVPPELETEYSKMCLSETWNICKRVLINNPSQLRERLESNLFYIEIAGVPKIGKLEVRGRFMGFMDAKVLLEPGEYGASICTKLYYFNEAGLPENVTPLLELPSSSAKPVVRETDDVLDDFKHMTFVTLRFDIIEPLVPKLKISTLFDLLGFKKIEGPIMPTDVLHVSAPPEDFTIDVRKIRKEEGAISVHAELSSMACTGAVVMNQSIKKTAANKLLIRVKSMLKQFPPGKCSNIDWQDIVTAQHSAARRAVTASFSPQPPPLYVPSHLAAARSRLAGDSRMAEIVTNASAKISPDHPKTFLMKALRYIEQCNDKAAHECLQKGVSIQHRNKYLLWAFGAQEYDKYPDGAARATAVFRIAAKSNNNDGTSNALGWAALHALYHCTNRPYASFVAAKKMRKAYKLPKDWKGFMQRWTDISEEEESLWDPAALDTTNPLVIASSFFLSLRAYKFSDLLLKCCESGCATRGVGYSTSTRKFPAINYLRAASLLIRGKVDKALDKTLEGILKNGPSSKMLQMKATCLLFANGWDGICEKALAESERGGAESSPVLLLRAAMGGLRTNPHAALQRAARAHKSAPCAHSALVIGRVYMHLEEDELAERWVAAAVTLEPNLADGWAFLAYIAARREHIDKARSLLRTAHQAGPISDDILKELNRLMLISPVQTLADSLMKDLCFCDYLG